VLIYTVYMIIPICTTVFFFLNLAGFVSLSKLGLFKLNNFVKTQYV